MTTPSDSDDMVHKAFRLGWYVAEVRGRNRPDRPNQGNSTPGNGVLRLRYELSDDELRCEARCVLVALAEALTVDTQRAFLGPLELNAAANGSWDILAQVLYQFDIHVQDELTARSEMEACAYLLGRGLAETYWELNPGDEASWARLFSEQRCTELSRLLGRLSTSLGAYTSPAIGGSLEVWKKYVTRIGNETADNRGRVWAELRDQARHWYELVVVEQDPTTLVKPFAMLRSFRLLRKTARQFWPHAVLALGSITAILWVLVMLGPGADTAIGKAVGVVVGVLGLTAAGIAGTLKNSAQSVLVRLRQDAYTELIIDAVTVKPETMSDWAKRAAIGQRQLTPITPG